MNWLIKASLIIIPFYEIILFSLPSSSPNMINTRVGKELVFLYLIISISIFGLFNGIKKINNKFIYLFMGALLLNHHFMPKVFVDSSPFSSPWFYESALVLVFSFLFFLTIASSTFKVKEVFNIISWVGFIMALYGLGQFFGLDQFYTLKPKEVISITEAPNVAGNLGQPTILASFLAMCIPIQLCLRKHWFGFITFLVICLCQAKMAIFASIAGVLVYYIYRSDNRIYWFKVAFCTFLAIVCGYMGYSHFKPNKLLVNNGRYGIWKEILIDIKDGRVLPIEKDYSLTGYGLGSFKFFNPKLHEGNWDKAHNEYLQVFYELGLIGIILLILAIFSIYDSSYFVFMNTHYGAVGALTVTILCAVYYFQWHLPAHSLYSLIILGILYKGEEK